jgi:GntR family transcriptional regulator
MTDSDPLPAELRLRVSTTDGLPIYLQLVNQIKYLVASGRLSSGEELPAIRVLAEKLLINPNTVARAYRELELAGVVEKRRTNGTFIAQGGSRLADGERRRIIEERVDALLAEAKQLGVSVQELLEIVETRNLLLTEGDLIQSEANR